MNKKDRLSVYNKYDGHCAYCGKKIEYKDMQVDHQTASCNGGTNDVDNLFPSCRRCNHYKRSQDLEEYREYIRTLHERIKKPYINKVAIDYEIIEVIPFDGKFYFEKVKK
ncbi:MAG: HNH endonuclease signature motif containing protein [Peptostreptococcales bacterium]